MGRTGFVEDGGRVARQRCGGKEYILIYCVLYLFY
jgi:hypothetical protein